MTGVLLRSVEVEGRLVDVQVADGRVATISSAVSHRPRPDGIVIDGHGGALVPGLHDHHLHLFSMAAAARSVVIGPPEVRDPATFDMALRQADGRLARGEWLRAVGYHESVAGPLDRWRLDALVPDRPARVQHRTGRAWVLNTTGLVRLGLDRGEVHGMETDSIGRPLGILIGRDDLLRDRLPSDGRPDLRSIGLRLASYGVTGVTDATPIERLDDLRLLAEAVHNDLPQRVTATGGPALTSHKFPACLERGPVKLIVADHALPELDTLIVWIRAAHRSVRPVAVHSVSRVALVLTLAALNEASPMPGDRIEHGAVVPPECADVIASLGVAVVTQPSFIYERGDQYLVDVDPDDRPHLYRCSSLLRRGISVGGSTDAPFGHADPWRAMASAVERRTFSGARIGADERVSPEQSLAMFTSEPDDPGGAPRRVAPGERADLCLLDAPLAQALSEPSLERVTMTMIAGRLVWRR